MTGPDSVARRFLEALAGAGPVGGPRRRLCDACLAVLPFDGAAVVLIPRVAHRELVCASDDTVERLEELQLTLGEGPGVEAYGTGGPVLVSDLDGDDGHRWPVFAASLPAGRTGGLFAFPLQVGAIRMGVLDLYRHAAGPLATAELAAALGVAEILTRTLLTSADGSHEPLALDHLLEESSLSREINQATGMVLAQLHVSPEEAYVRLRSVAFTQNRRIGDVARDIVARRLRLDPDEA
jgi:ANTAR domain